MSMSENVTPTCLWDVQATLGEGVMWDAANACVWFVDIKGHRIYRCDPDGASQASWDAPSQVSFIVPVAGGGYVCGLEDGLHRFDPATGAFTALHRLEVDLPGNRFNDGHVDPHGRLWCGSMDNAETVPSGVLYRYDGATAQAMDDGYVITNGPAVSHDARTLYHTDTLKKEIYAFDLSPHGSLSNKRLFVTLRGGGHPDGMAVDADNHLWVATFGGGRTVRFAPDGTEVGEVRFPCANITKLAFGGPDLRTVFVTTARKGLSDADLAAQPLAGGLFTFRAGTPGLPQQLLQLKDMQ
jgi:sugar lactone lactonase YvrE